MNGLGGSKMKRSQQLTTPEEGSEKNEDATGLMKNFPWLGTFDGEAKSRLTVPDVTSRSVLKLIALLESHVSPEVTKLKNKLIRATRFLAQVRRRISMVKMGGYMIDREDELQLFPSYGLLLTHFVNITLNSSKIDLYGAQQVAQEIYYFLKLMFQEDTEYVLDIALSSTLDEHAASKHKVGFQLFSYIVEDWRAYTGTHSSLMKYCAVCSILSESSYEGQIFVERNVSTKSMDSGFPKFLTRTLNIDFSGSGMDEKKAFNLKTVIKAIKATPVKSVSRSRLVLVSKKELGKAKTMRDRERSSSDLSDAESIDSTVINNPKSSKSHQYERPSASGQRSKSQDCNSMDNFFNDLGIGFCLDRVGSRDPLQGSSSGTTYMYDRGEILTESLTNQEDVLGLESSTVTSKAGAIAIKTELKTEEEEASDSDNDSFVSNAHNAQVDDDAELRNKSVSLREVEETVEQHQLPSGQLGNDGKNEEEQVEDMIVDVGQDDHDQGEQFGQSGYEPSSDHEEQYNNGGGLMEMEDDADAEVDNDSDNGSSPKSNGLGTMDKLKKNVEDADKDSDSDLEVLSVKGLDDTKDDDADDSSVSSGCRDEAEPESGEDYVPDYTRSTDDEDEGVDVDDEKMEKEQGKAKPGGEELAESSDSELDTPQKEDGRTPISPSPSSEQEESQTQQQSQQSQNSKFELESSVVSGESSLMSASKGAPIKSTPATAIKAASKSKIHQNPVSSRDSSQSSTKSSEGTPSKCPN